MGISAAQPTRSVGQLAVYVSETAHDLGLAAATHVAARMRDLAGESSMLPVVFATGASQLETLRALVTMPGLPWDRVIGFHLDEYVGLRADHPASFRHYLKKELVDRVPIGQFHFLEGDAPDIEKVCGDYAELLQSSAPKLCVLGIGENGHLAFNDPHVADFDDEWDVKVVTLDDECRQQQVAEGWFPSLSEVPDRAITLTVPAIMRIQELVASVPGARKTRIVERTLSGEISTRCPATVLRTHPNARLYVDRDSFPRTDQYRAE